MRLPGSKKNLADSKSREDRMKMIDRKDKKISIKKQAELLGLNRTSLYYKPVPVSDEEYLIKRIIDEIYTAHPEYGIYCIIKTDEVAKKFPQFCNDDFLIIAKGH